ncbi:uncharacterized protein DUF2000 [Hydrogenispora ethanolica]|uniref:Uncharacterized protein DUF2000 n=1 Tax=Hydrogenispora ethanolica TaxID=1082276 RepID=A0A4R1RAK8_HYDET|nr:DUF2000 domain-containing protein [Hydrogenispora ethanolica]TCL62746.1 uncharacterized protein DUF2000 [Hydrogenispora ethanolica]
MKIVMLIDPQLPLGLIANTAAVLGLSLGNQIEPVIGPAIPDADGREHAGITGVSIPILSATRAEIQALRESLYDPEHAAVGVIDFSSVAQRSKSYEDYTRSLAGSGGGDLQYLGICLFGPEPQINRLTGNMRLLR